MRARRTTMDYPRVTSHPFDMNEYFSGQRFCVGGRDYEKEDRDELMDSKDSQRGTPEIDKLPGRGIKEILRAIHRQ